MGISRTNDLPANLHFSKILKNHLFLGPKYWLFPSTHASFLATSVSFYLLLKAIARSEPAITSGRVSGSFIYGRYQLINSTKISISVCDTKLNSPISCIFFESSMYSIQKKPLSSRLYFLIWLITSVRGLVLKSNGSNKGNFLSVLSLGSYSL